MRWDLHQEAPFKWLIALTGRSYFLLHLLMAVVVFFTGIRKLINSNNLQVAIVCWCGTLFLLLMGCNSRTLALRPQLLQVVNAMGMCCYTAFLSLYCLYDTDMISRHRTMGMNVVVWRAVLPLVCFRLRPASFAIVVGTMIELFLTWLTFHRFGETGSFFWVAVASGACSLAGIGWVYQWTLSWQKSHAMHQQLAAEKEAFEALLALVCDAAFWVAVDGDTLLPVDGRLDMIMGISMQGMLLSEHMPPDERPRLRHTFATLSSEAPVSLLPTTIQRNPTSTINVDLFIVDRRQAFASRQQGRDQKEQLGFLVGLRLGQAPAVASGLLASPPQAEAGCAKLAAGLELGLLPLPARSQVICETAAGQLQPFCTQDVLPGARLLCVDCRTGAPCLAAVDDVQQVEVRERCRLFLSTAEPLSSTTSTLDGGGLEVPPAARLLLQPLGAAGKRRWRPIEGIQPNSALKVQVLVSETEDLTRLTEQQRKLVCVEQLPHVEGRQWVALRLHIADGRPEDLAVCVSYSTRLGASGAGDRCTVLVALGLPRRSTPSAASSTGSSDLSMQSGTSSAPGPALPPHCRAKLAAPVGLPYMPSGLQLIEHSESLLKDLLHAWNFEGSGCCARHAAFDRLRELLEALAKDGACRSKWPPESPTWQCASCRALHFPADNQESCWVCCSSRAHGQQRPAPAAVPVGVEPVLMGL